jgi:hypothetical protein
LRTCTRRFVELSLDGLEPEFHISKRYTTPTSLLAAD